MSLQHPKIQIKTDDNTSVNATAPFIISASRATDIPAFYTDWLIYRLKKGYVRRKNPFNGKFYYISFRNTSVIVFWSKNPLPLLKKLEQIDNIIPNYYFQFTLNNYDNRLEPNLPPLSKRIETFIKLSERIGKEKVIWRFDPFVITDYMNTEQLLRRVEQVFVKINKYTEKMVFSFVDIKKYRKVEANMIRKGIKYKEFSRKDILFMAKELQKMFAGSQVKLATCAESIDLTNYGITHNKCIDDQLMKRLFAHDKKLMAFLTTPYSKLKDKGQRPLCKCIISKDIGSYDTCPHLCTYCYANKSEQTVRDNYNRIRNNFFSDYL